MKPTGAPSRPVRVRRVRNGEVRRERDAVATEEPLEVRVAWIDPATGERRAEAVAVTMRTPGHDYELAAGFLSGEGVLARPEHLHEITYCRSGRGPQEYNVVEARLHPGVSFDLERVRRNVYTTSSCGVCGKASLDAVEALGYPILDDDGWSMDPDLIPGLPDRLMAEQGVFQRTGGLHAAGLFDATGTLDVLREDVGRHNAVDKVVGRRVLDGRLPAPDRVLVVSGRASFELVQKAVAAGIPMLVAVGAPSSLAVDLAERFGLTLVGFARDGGFNVYSGAARLGL
ncbi:MAG: formate dehydrogenase accessory sulfurtransferase FdhD [Longimicrobiales bacterium]